MRMDRMLSMFNWNENSSFLLTLQEQTFNKEMNWIQITDQEQVKNIAESDATAIIYKHSPRCATSLMAYRQLKSEVNGAAGIDAPIYIVDVIDNRKESQTIAEIFQVEHESPQLLVVKNKASLFDVSHEDVSLKDALPYLT